MHIVIDLQGSLGAGDSAFGATLDQLVALARGAGQHRLTLALPSSLERRIGAVRAAVAGLDGVAGVAVYSLPAVQAKGRRSAWLERAGAPIRAAFLAGLAPDLVYLPGLAGADAGAPGLADPDGLLACPQAVGLGPAPAARPAQLEALQAAALLLAEPAHAPAWRGLLNGASVHEAAGAVALWALFAATVLARAPGAAQRAGVRPRLAYISPLPPEQSGIADYSAELLPELARYYDVEIILDQPVLAEGWVKSTLTQRSLDWFEQHARGYDRVLYHFGNSLMHKHMFALLERHPGVVVLHDFFLANVLHAMHYSGFRPHSMQQALLASHGVSALQDMGRHGEHAAVWKYPCNKQVLDAAEGVIVHSDYPRQLARRWYGEQAAAGWRCLPLLRGHPVQDRSERSRARAAARNALGLRDGQILVCTFGLLGRTKLNHKLFDAWQASSLATDADCQLVFVGDAGDSDYGLDIMSSIQAVRRKYRPRITGYVSQQLYQTYLAACDIAVQLRAESRGETSAAVLDCLLHGIPTIANAHGSSSELPETVLLKIDDEFSLDQLAQALERLRADPALRSSLGQLAMDYIEREHAPEHVGLAYRDALEDFALHSPKRRYRSLLRAVAAIDGLAPSQPEQIAAATAIALNQPACAPRQLFVDISALVQTDLKTGIQRVVRAILQELLDQPPAGYRIEPVYSKGRNEPYRYARRTMLGPIDCHLHDLEDAPAEMRAGDLFLGIDLLIHMVAENQPQLQQFKERGGQVYFVVYDLLPVLRPDVFPETTDAYFADWLATVGAVADGLLCISRAVADELADWMRSHPPQRADPLNIGWFHLGADIGASAPSFGMPDNAAEVLREVKARPSLIMVGTVEPRKGQLQALDACELLWQAGQEVNLVIVGKQGWMMEGLAKRLREHGEQGRKLFWLPGVSDEMLLALYQASAALLAPSEGEGFGLPLIEAAQHGLPIIARDLPVFREVAGEHASYFSGKSAAELADALAAWLVLWREGKAPAVDGMRWLNWKDSAGQLLDAMIGQQWYRAVAPAAPERTQTPAAGA